VKTIDARLQDVSKLIVERRLQSGLLLQRGTDKQRRAFDKALETLEQAADKFVESTRLHDAAPVPSTEHRIASLTDALERVGKSRRPGLFPIDTLHSLIVQNCDPADASYWHSEPEQAFVGFVRFCPPLVDDLRQRGVLVWTRDEDELVRLVHVGWLQSDAEIAHFVGSDAPGGHTCRFCQITEPADSTDLEPVDPDVPGTDRCHSRCLDHWRRWVAIAERFEADRLSEIDTEAAVNN